MFGEFSYSVEPYSSVGISHVEVFGLSSSVTIYSPSASVFADAYAVGGFSNVITVYPPYESTVFVSHVYEMFCARVDNRAVYIVNMGDSLVYSAKVSNILVYKSLVDSKACD